MGVRGLETFLNAHPECIKPVNIEELALAYRAKYKRSPKLMIDSGTCLRFLMNKKPWISGHQLKVMDYTLEMFLKRFQSIGIEVTCFYDGLVHPDKFDNWVIKQTEIISDVNKIFYLIRSNQNEVSKIEFHKMYSTNVKKVMVDCYKKFDFQVYQSAIGSNKEAAMYARKNHYFGILAQDSDFLIHNCAEYYFSMKQLDLETLNTFCYRADIFAEILNLSTRQLPLLATFMGNGIVHFKSLKKFHKSLFKGNEKFSSADSFFKVAKFIKENVKPNQSLNSQLPDLSKLIFRTASKAYFLRNSLKSYNVFSQEEDNFIHELDDPEWIDFLKITLQLHKVAKLPSTVYQILSQSKYFLRITMTDPNKQNNQLWFEIAQKLRRKIYGILLMNKPQLKGRSWSIKEIYIDTNTGKHEHYVEPNYPEMKVDLLKLWLDVEGLYNEDKWNLFCASLKIERDILPVEEIHLLIPVVSLKYLLMDRFEIAAWELEAVLASMLLLQYYSVEDLEAIPEFPLDPDGVHLYWYLMDIFDLVAILNSVCGYPIDSELASPIHYQDGKLFHQKYREAKENKPFETLFEFRENEIRSGKKIMAMIYE